MKSIKRNAVTIDNATALGDGTCVTNEGIVVNIQHSYEKGERLTVSFVENTAIWTSPKELSSEYQEIENQRASSSIG